LLKGAEIACRLFRFMNQACRREPCCARLRSRSGRRQNTIARPQTKSPPATARSRTWAATTNSSQADPCRGAQHRRRSPAGTLLRDLPWDDNGYRVLPAAVYMEHTEKLREYTRQFRAAVEAFVFQSFKLTGGAQLWEERLPKHASSAGLERNCFIAGVL